MMTTTPLVTPDYSGPPTDRLTTADGHDLITQARRWAERGYQYQQGDEPLKAITCYSQAIQLLPDLLNVHAYRGTCYFVLHDYAAAAADFSAELNAQPDQLLLYRKRALAYLHLKHYPPALADFEGIRNADPTLWLESCRLAHASALYHLGLQEAGCGNLDAAIRLLTESIQMAPEASEGIRPRLLALHERRRQREIEQEQRVQDQRQAEARRQSRIEADRQREIAARRQREVEAALHHDRALQYLAQGDYGQALAKFNEALRYDPTLAAVYVSRARVLLIQAEQMDDEASAGTFGWLRRQQRLYRAALDSYNTALELGVELLHINGERLAARQLLLRVEAQIALAPTASPEDTEGAFH